MEIYGKLPSPHWNRTPTRLHRHCFSTTRTRAKYGDFGLPGHILHEIVHACYIFVYRERERERILTV
ncbi:putative ribosomal protein S14 [Helianthus annuus]|nr:putative ribosomal protein S14 [Helianthus annuus]